MKEIKCLLQALDAVIVGGAVRDYVRTGAWGSSGDVDLASPHTPEVVMGRLADLDLPVYPLGVAHGTVATLVGGVEVEITTFRTEVGQGRKAQVTLGATLEEDLSRRDFTINAMAMALDGAGFRLVDPFGGTADLDAGVVRAVGDAHARFTEDRLRPLRAFRFAETFGFRLADGLLEAAAALAPGVGGLVSVERFLAETKKALASPKGGETYLRLADQAGYLAEFGLLKPKSVAALPADLRFLGLVGDPSLGRTLRLSRRDVRVLEGLAMAIQGDTLGMARRAFRSPEWPDVVTLAAWAGADAELPAPLFPPRRLMDLGVPPGPILSAKADALYLAQVAGATEVELLGMV